MTLNVQPLMANVLGLNGGEVVIVPVAILILCLNNRIPDLARNLRQGLLGFRDASDQLGIDAGRNVAGSFGKPAAEALTLDNQTVELDDPAELRDLSSTLTRAEHRQTRFGVKLLERFKKFCSRLKRGILSSGEARRRSMSAATCD